MTESQLIAAGATSRGVNLDAIQDALNPPASPPQSSLQSVGQGFVLLCRAHGIPEPQSEYRFAPPRKWRADWFWKPDLALEIQGAIFTQGRHTRGAALLKEHEKLNEFACRGIRVIYCTPKEVKDGSIFPTIRRALNLS